MFTRRFILQSLLAATVIAPLGIAASNSEAQARSRPTSAPPPSRDRPPQPRRGYTWVPGYWRWDGRRGWVWTEGFWERNHPGRRLEGPRWVLRRGEWVFIPSRWVRSW